MFIKILNKDIKRKTVLYARVSTVKQKKDLQNQIDQMRQWCFMNGYTISAIYSDVASGIETIIHEEKYTSKCSFLDNESIDHHDNYAGKRIQRGIFRSSNGTLIHADLQASYNIIRKAIPEAFANGIEGMGLYPRSLSVKKMITSKGIC